MTNILHTTLIKYMSSHLPISLASRSLYKDNRSIHHEDIKIINIQVLRITTSKYMKNMLTELKGSTESNTIVGDFNTLLSTMDGSPRVDQQGNTECE